ncbi:hypothetical protein J4E05_23680, partial [Thalassospira sp. NFXS8]|uniref:hypothetical protein n=1 Tax=Thalassospira sp. NFXS8 TaxID=2819093 RepID=UPI0032DE6D56
TWQVLDIDSKDSRHKRNLQSGIAFKRRRRLRGYLFPDFSIAYKQQKTRCANNGFLKRLKLPT